MLGNKNLRKAMTVLAALVIVLPLVVTPVSALWGEAVINPIESNIAGKYWVAPSASSGGDSAALAIDGDAETAWLAGDSNVGHWLMLDLAGEYDNLRKTEVIFVDATVAYQYVIEASSDAISWDVIVDRTRNRALSEGSVDLFTRPGTRFLRLTITGATPGATVGIRELRVYNYLRENIINGADMSYMDQYSARQYWVNYDTSVPGRHVLDVVKEQGMEFIRLRLWNEPRSESSGALTSIPRIGPDRTAMVAGWIKDRGLQLGIDFHYADSWADPGKQPKPQAWAALEFDDLVTAMHDFSYAYVRRLVEQGTTPDKVAVGNEIINGFLWGSETSDMGLTTINPAYVRNNQALYLSQPGGGLLWRYWGSTDPIEQQKYEESWDRFSTLVAAGIRAVREASPETRVELHAIVDRDRLPKSMEFWTQLLTRIKAKGADVDSIGTSYYPEWHGTLAFLEESLHSMATAFPEYGINVPEHSWYASGGAASFDEEPRTVQGQANMYQNVIRIVNDVIDNRGIGMLLWEPQSWQTMFRSYGSSRYEAHASIGVFSKSLARHVLENNVYLTTTEGTAPGLPATVRMLTMSDGSVGPVPVTWDTVAPELYGTRGTFTVTGSTDFGEVEAKVTVIYGLVEFLPPMSNPPAVNDAKAGSTIPLKFSLADDYGLGIFAPGYPASREINCATGAQIGGAEESVTPGSSSLSYSADSGQYVYVWKTDKAWAGTCRELTIRLTDVTGYTGSTSLDVVFK